MRRFCVAGTTHSDSLNWSYLSALRFVAFLWPCIRVRLIRFRRQSCLKFSFIFRHSTLGLRHVINIHHAGTLARAKTGNVNDMKLKNTFFSLLLLWTSAALGAQQPPADPLAENLFPPELVMQHQSEIGLTEKQRDALMSEIQSAQERFAGLQERLQKEVEAMAALLRKESSDEQAALAQVDKVLDREREIKRAHLGLLLRIKSKLTHEQVARLREIKNKIASGQLRSLEEVQRSLQTKLQSVQEGVQQWQGEGRDPSPVAEIMQEFDSSMKTGKHKEAEALLDRALNLLRAPDKDGPEKEPKKSAAAPPSVRNRFAASAITPEALEAEIKSLQPARVPWRDIAWTSCLLDGLKESRAKQKPLLLWVFIDRPADDARC